MIELILVTMELEWIGGIWEVLEENVKLMLLLYNFYICSRRIGS